MNEEKRKEERDFRETEGKWRKNVSDIKSRSYKLDLKWVMWALCRNYLGRVNIVTSQYRDGNKFNCSRQRISTSTILNTSHRLSHSMSQKLYMIILYSFNKFPF